MTENSQKNCLLVFKSKKIQSSSKSNKLLRGFADGGYWFDKLSYVAYDNPDEIVRAVKDGVKHYGNLVLYCPQAMANTLKSFIVKLCGGEFNENGVLNTGACDVYLLVYDGENALKVNDICAAFNRKYNCKFEKAYVKTVGAPAETINAAVAAAGEVNGAFYFAVNDSFGDCTIEVTYPAYAPKNDFDEVLRRLMKGLNEYVYALENVTLAEQLKELLKLRRMKISVAESFTGGGICKRLVAVSGVSEVFAEGLNTYSNLSKQERLGVNKHTLKVYGAVSKETATEMAQGLINSGSCDVCVATTGIAGPKSDDTKKPVGLAYISVGTADGVTAYEYHFKGDRENITETAINYALFLVYKAIK